MRTTTRLRVAAAAADAVLLLLLVQPERWQLVAISWRRGTVVIGSTVAPEGDEQECEIEGAAGVRAKWRRRVGYDEGKRRKKVVGVDVLLLMMKMQRSVKESRNAAEEEGQGELAAAAAAGCNRRELELTVHY